MLAGRSAAPSPSHIGVTSTVSLGRIEAPGALTSQTPIRARLEVGYTCRSTPNLAIPYLPASDLYP